jgi:hypothetical protein
MNPRWCHWGFFRGIRQFHVSGVNSASKNEYQDNPGGKDGQCVRLTTYHLQVPMSRNLNLTEPSGPHRPVMEFHPFYRPRSYLGRVEV